MDIYSFEVLGDIKPSISNKDVFDVTHMVNEYVRENKKLRNHIFLKYNNFSSESIFDNIYGNIKHIIPCLNSCGAPFSHGDFSNTNLELEVLMEELGSDKGVLSPGGSIEIENKLYVYIGYIERLSETNRKRFMVACELHKKDGSYLKCLSEYMKNNNLIFTIEDFPFLNGVSTLYTPSSLDYSYF